jgi:DUF4097 and DUF4098 domain-containing protein YvlB
MAIFTSKNNLNTEVMKKILSTLVMSIAIFLTMHIQAQTTSSEQLSVPLSSPGKQYTLNVSLVNGSIKVASYAGKDILIEVNVPGKTGKETTEDVGNGMKRISPRNSFDITAKEDNNTVTVNSNDVNRTVALSLKIPQDVKLKLSTVNDGDIDVDNVNGELEINNVNGEIKLTHIGGSIVASTVNGDLIATFNSIDAKAPMAFSTLNGNVDVSFPPSAKANLKLKSDRGEIFTDFDIDIDKSEPKIDRSNHAGMYQLKLEDWVIGKINGGGPEVLMKNMDGNIYVRKSK